MTKSFDGIFALEKREETYIPNQKNRRTHDKIHHSKSSSLQNSLLVTIV